MVRRRHLPLGLAMGAVWWLALRAWPDLPERVPTHFGAEGRPDAWAEKGLTQWFLPPVLATLCGILLGFVLPNLLMGMARRNSPWLNVPARARFRALPEAARVRAVQPPGAWLGSLAVAMQLLFAWLVLGSTRVASGEWQAIPPVPTYLLVGVVVSLAIVLVVAGTRAVRAEVARHGPVSRG